VSVLEPVPVLRRRRDRMYSPTAKSTSALDALTQNVHVRESTETIHIVEER